MRRSTPPNTGMDGPVQSSVPRPNAGIERNEVRECKGRAQQSCSLTSIGRNDYKLDTNKINKQKLSRRN